MKIKDLIEKLSSWNEDDEVFMLDNSIVSVFKVKEIYVEPDSPDGFVYCPSKDEKQAVLLMTKEQYEGK